MRTAKGRVAVTPEMAAGLQAAIDAAGNRHRLAVGLGLDRSGVLRWEKVPAEWCRDIERKFGVDRAVLRPDIFGEDEEA